MRQSPPPLPDRPICLQPGEPFGYVLHIPQPPTGFRLVLERRDHKEVIGPAEGFRLDFGPVVILVRLEPDV